MSYPVYANEYDEPSLSDGRQVETANAAWSRRSVMGGTAQHSAMMQHPSAAGSYTMRAMSDNNMVAIPAQAHQASLEQGSDNLGLVTGMVGGQHSNDGQNVRGAPSWTPMAGHYTADLAYNYNVRGYPLSLPLANDAGPMSGYDASSTSAQMLTAISQT